jgi:hypothetical protein
MQGKHHAQGHYLLHAALKTEIKAVPAELKERHLLAGHLHLLNHLRLPSLPEAQDLKLQGVPARPRGSHPSAHPATHEEDRLLLPPPLELPPVPLTHDRPQPEDQGNSGRPQGLPAHHRAIQVHVSARGARGERGINPGIIRTGLQRPANVSHPLHQNHRRRIRDYLG